METYLLATAFGSTIVYRLLGLDGNGDAVLVSVCGRYSAAAPKHLLRST